MIYKGVWESRTPVTSLDFTREASPTRDIRIHGTQSVCEPAGTWEAERCVSVSLDFKLDSAVAHGGCTPPARRASDSWQATIVRVIPSR